MLLSEVSVMYDLLREEGQLYLEHSGILGQKWGVRNGPPYPLEEHTNAHKRAGFRESILKTRLKKKSEDKNIKTAKNTKKDKTATDKKDKTATRKARGKAATAAALVIAGLVIVGAARHPRLVKKEPRRLVEC